MGSVGLWKLRLAQTPKLGSLRSMCCNSNVGARYQQQETAVRAKAKRTSSDVDPEDFQTEANQHSSDRV